MSLDGCRYLEGGKSLPSISAKHFLPVSMLAFRMSNRPSSCCVPLPLPIPPSPLLALFASASQEAKRFLTFVDQNKTINKSVGYRQKPLDACTSRNINGERKLLTVGGRTVVTSSCSNTLHICLSLRQPRPRHKNNCHT